MLKYLVLLISLFPCFGFSLNQSYDKVTLVSEIVRDYKSLKINKMTVLENPDNKIFLPSYWKVYYKSNKIVAEELYKDGNLSYFYIYYYAQNKVYQKGFFWQGITLNHAVFKTPTQDIKQGFFYKSVPDSYRVFDETSAKMTYEYFFPQSDI